jgi:hypothetical protein
MDSTSLWVTWQKHKNNLGWIAAIILSLAIGWQSGRMMSPYYAAHPIVLTDVPKEEITAQLQDLKQAGIAARPVSNKEPVVAAATTTTAPNSPEFVASKNSTLYHHSSCPAAKQIKPENLRQFKTAQDAELAGLTPSKCTLEKVKQ